jgi:hypothetical protein
VNGSCVGTEVGGVGSRKVPGCALEQAVASVGCARIPPTLGVGDVTDRWAGAVRRVPLGRAGGDGHRRLGLGPPPAGYRGGGRHRPMSPCSRSCSAWPSLVRPLELGGRVRTYALAASVAGWPPPCRSPAGRSVGGRVWNSSSPISWRSAWCSGLSDARRCSGRPPSSKKNDKRGKSEGSLDLRTIGRRWRGWRPWASVSGWRCRG